MVKRRVRVTSASISSFFRLSFLTRLSITLFYTWKKRQLPINKQQQPSLFEKKVLYVRQNFLLLVKGKKMKVLSLSSVTSHSLLLALHASLIRNSFLECWLGSFFTSSYSHNIHNHSMELVDKKWDRERGKESASVKQRSEKVYVIRVERKEDEKRWRILKDSKPLSQRMMKDFFHFSSFHSSSFFHFFFTISYLFLYESFGDQE